MNTAVILNPRAGRRRGWKRAAGVLAAAFGEFELRTTRGPGHATELAAELLGRGFTRVIAAGGDGTASEVAAAFLSRPGGRDQAFMGVLPLGTGSDLARSLGMPRHTREAAAALAHATPLAIDAARATFQDFAGRPCRRWFVNMASFGLGGAVAAAGPPAGTRGRIRYFLRALGALRGYTPASASLTLDGRPADLAGPIAHIAVGNARSQGAGIVICPDACLDDGLLNITAILALRPREVLRSAGVLYSGAIYSHSKVRHWRAARVRAEAGVPVALELDGDSAGLLPLEIEVVPRALPMLICR